MDNDFLLKNIKNTINEVNLKDFKRISKGKVRDSFLHNNQRIIVTTDRQSAFDRVIATVPFKGQVLNTISKFWFEKTSDIVKNHLIAVPHKNVSITKSLEIFPVEFVIRSYLTGSTSTSIWKQYKKGVRKYCGVDLPDGMIKNQKLEKTIITPTTKSDIHDELISPEEIINRGLMTEQDWKKTSSYALALFDFAQKFVSDRGLILVDTKLEFGKDKETGEIYLADEVFTPDSSRYWMKDSYDEKFKNGESPISFDKDVIRKWFNDNCDPYNDETLPEAPDDIILKVAEVYTGAYEMITGEKFTPDLNDIQSSVEEYFNKN